VLYCAGKKENFQNILFRLNGAFLICRLVAEKGIISSFYGIALFDLTNENVFGLLLLLFSWPTLSFAVMLLFFG
jgi:hypothetical protein